MSRARGLTALLRKVFPRHEPFAFAVDYRRDSKQWRLADVGFFVHGLPRLTLWCRLFGHRPVVDGTAPVASRGGYVSQAYMWVSCSRCRVRADPQGSLDTGQWRIGQRYTGPLDTRSAEVRQKLVAQWKTGAAARPLLEPPGRIEALAKGKVGGQLVIGNSYPGFEIEFKVGSAGSEHTLAFTLRLGWLGALYLHTEGFGEGLARMLNKAEQSRLIGCYAGGTYRTFGWKLWARRWRGYEPDTRQRWPWQQVDVHWQPIDRLLGRKQYQYTDIGTQHRIVRMPEGDYLVKLTLQRVRFGRDRQLRRPRMSWSVDWTADQGIPTKPGNRGRVFGAAVAVSDEAAGNGMWPAEAAAAVALKMTQDRVGNQWEPTGTPRPVTT